MCVVDEAPAEGAQPQRHHHAVVQDLRRHVGLADVVLEVAHEEEVAGRVEAVVEGVVGDVAEHRSRAGPVVAVLVHRHAQELKLLRVVGLRVKERERDERLMVTNRVAEAGVCWCGRAPRGTRQHSEQDMILVRR